VTFLPGAPASHEGHAWNNVDARPSGSISSPWGARAVTLFSFERPARHALLAGVPAAQMGRRVDARYLEGHGPAHLENCIVEKWCSLPRDQENKGTRWMPWHQEPKKDVGGCDKPRGAAERALIRGFPNGETHPW
jgi:hypothetical protein